MGKWGKVRKSRQVYFACIFNGLSCGKLGGGPMSLLGEAHKKGAERGYFRRLIGCPWGFSSFPRKRESTFLRFTSLVFLWIPACAGMTNRRREFRVKAGSESNDTTIRQRLNLDIFVPVSYNFLRARLASALRRSHRAS